MSDDRKAAALKDAVGLYVAYENDDREGAAHITAAYMDDPRSAFDLIYALLRLQSAACTCVATTGAALDEMGIPMREVRLDELDPDARRELAVKLAQAVAYGLAAEDDDE